MSKRFGRNQKRKLLAEITNLKTEVDNATIALIVQQTGEWLRAGEGHGVALDTLVDFIGEKEVTNSQRRGMRRRTASLTVWARDGGEALYRNAYNLVEWEGICWRLNLAEFDTSIASDHYVMMCANEMEIGLKLEAISSAKVHQPYSYLLTSSNRDYCAAEAVDGRRFYPIDPRPEIRVKARTNDFYHTDSIDRLIDAVNQIDIAKETMPHALPS
ncbi:hypothetical protein LAV_00126 [Sphingobium phage Lacusarx]|uniref:Uncharacterized protein n=1 Tax=Sphingobium phage Lacusarx TaxID=1980139 RepID=A0A1W6DX79_9CAUD|nr:hypothetical protein FDH44_gp177 [Sphingobium phage Lacusarx]ARK07501.1 hypothetical protein LAV_00126 [Sphingobium phage Lacusarx]